MHRAENKEHPEQRAMPFHNVVPNPVFVIASWPLTSQRLHVTGVPDAVCM
jgi:hypothetical protein